MLQVKNLSFRYRGSEINTIDNLSFKIGQGEIFGFLGPSGSGKSTTQKILFKLLKGYEGEVAFQNKPLHKWSYDFYEKIGVGFELPNHYLKLTAYENLRFFASFYKKQTANLYELMEMVGLKDDAGKLVSEYSKGMKMRLNFIRALIHDPEMIFLDEPTSGLDPVNARIIKNIILDLKKQGKTIFITTHSMYDADLLCDKVALLANGKINALESPALLKQQYGKQTVKVLTKDDQREHIFEMDNLAGNEDFLRILQTNQINTIHSEEATLEDVFIKLTGKTLA